ncbi:LuxR C-terminal-related transcriptional regulator [Cellulomonas sp. P5_E12]
MGVVDDLERARDAYERREWVAAYDALSDADDSALDAQDFSRLAVAAYLLGRQNDCVQALQRAYKAHIDAGETVPAVRVGFWLSMVLLDSGESAVGAGWLGRCQRLLEQVRGDVVERGYVLVPAMMRHIYAGEFEPASRLATEITEYGRRFSDADLLAQGLNAQGRMLMYAGRVPEGMALLDEAMIGISMGEVSPIVAGHVYCSLIEACQEVFDYGRAAEWTAALTRWTEEQPGLVPFTGQCAIHRGQIMGIRGAFRAALEEFDRAVRRYLDSGTPWAAGLALAEAGNLHRICGDLDAAEADYERATGFGYESQPGLALLWLARGRTGAATNAVRRLLAEPRDPVHRSQLLAGSVEVLLATGEVEGARAIAEELAGIAEAFRCAALSAAAHQARASCLLSAGDAGAAALEARSAVSLWRSLEAPYDAARCQVLLGRALRDLGDGDSALAELSQARRVFQDLGAAPAERDVLRLVHPSRPAGLTEREVEVLRLVASGRSNSEIAAALVLSDKTVARHLSNIFTKLGVASRTAAAAFAYENGLL